MLESDEQALDASQPEPDLPTPLWLKLGKWAIVLLAGFAVLLAPVPEGITPKSWQLFAIFVATITGSIVRPLPGGAIVLLGVATIALTGVLTVNQALAGYADPIVWLVLAAFFMSRGMIKTGLGRRIAFLFIRAIGRHSLGLGYALVLTDMLLATVIPSTGARSGGIIFPVAKESGRGLRIEARGLCAPTRGIPDDSCVSVRRHRVCNVSYRTSVKCLDCEVCSGSDGNRINLHALGSCGRSAGFVVARSLSADSVSNISA